MAYTTNHRRKIRKYESTVRSKNPKTVVEQIRKGSELATETVVKLALDADVYIRELVKAGLVDAILAHLEHSSTPFQEYLAVLEGGGGYGDLTSPAVWVEALMSLCQEKNTSLGVTTTVAGRIGPLVDAMGKTEQREFFANKDYWLETYSLFICLIGCLSLTESARVLLQEQYDGAVENIVVRALFLDSHGGTIKEDILDGEKKKLCNPNSHVMIQNPAARALQEFSDVPLYDSSTIISPSDKRRLQFLAGIPVAPGVECTLAAGIFELLANANEAAKQGSCYSGLQYVYRKLQIGLGGECFRFVGFSKSNTCQLLIDISKRNILNYPDLGPTDVQSVQCSLSPSEPKAPEDDTVAAAIKHGVLEFIMQWVVRTRGSDERLMPYADLIIEMVGVTSLLPKTNKALRKGKDDIEKQLRLLKRQGCAPPMAGKIQALLNKAGLCQIASQSDRVVVQQCRSCSVLLIEGNEMRCARCKTAVYCSRDCQVRDWKHGGHKAECKYLKTLELTQEEALGSASAIRRAAKLEENLSSSGDALFPSNCQAILLQASLRGQRITDCVVVLCFTELVPTMETMCPEEFFALSRSLEENQHFRSIFEGNRSNGAITIACKGVAPNGHAVLLKTVPPENTKYFMPPMAALSPEERWCMLQMIVAEQSEYNVVELRNNREECDRVIQKLMVPTDLVTLSARLTTPDHA